MLIINNCGPKKKKIVAQTTNLQKKTKGIAIAIVVKSRVVLESQPVCADSVSRSVRWQFDRTGWAWV